MKTFDKLTVTFDDPPEGVQAYNVYADDENPNVHIMFDLETWGTGAAAVPISIGAVKFDIESGEILDKFEAPINPINAQKMGLAIQGDTVLWWMRPAQDEARRAWLALLDSHAQAHAGIVSLDLAEALDGFTAWYGKPDKPTWSNSPSFDSVIIGTAFQVSGMPKPWNHGKDRDLRSIRALKPWDWKPATAVEGAKHGGLVDAVYQVGVLIEIRKDLGLTFR